MSPLDKLSSHVRRWGWWRTVTAVMMRAASKVFGLEIFVLRTRETPNHDAGNQCEVPGVTFRRISDEELLRSTDDVSLPLQEKFVRPAMERGDWAFGAFHDGSLIAYAWRAVGSAPHYDDCWVWVEDPYSYSYNAFTKPEFRGQHLVPALLMFSDQEMRKSGYTHRAGIVAVSNYASLAMSKHMDSQNIGHIGFVKWFGRYRFFRSRSAAKIGIRFYQPSREKGESK